MSKVNRNLHILIIPSWYPRFDGDIGGSFFREQALALQKSGHQIGVIYPQFRSIKDVKGIYSKPYGVKYINDNGLQTFKYHHLSASKFQQKRWINTGLKLFKQYTKKFGFPDIIHVHSLRNAGYVALEINSRYNIPFVITEHSSSFARGLVSQHDIQNLTKVVQASSYNIAVSNNFCDLLNDTFNANIWNYIPNIVNNDFSSFDISYDYSKDKFIYLTICFLTETKGIDNLVRAFSLIHDKAPKATLRIGGDGIERENLEKLVKDLHLENKVIFLGNLSREKVKTEMARSSIFLLPSRYETFGVVLVEALALGRPVIATKCGGPESIVVDKVGSLVEVDDIKELSEAMLDAYINYDEYSSEDIRQYCIDNFSEKAVTTKLTDIYHSVLTGLH